METRGVCKMTAEKRIFTGLIIIVFYHLPIFELPKPTEEWYFNQEIIHMMRMGFCDQMDRAAKLEAFARRIR